MYWQFAQRYSKLYFFIWSREIPTIAEVLKLWYGHHRWYWRTLTFLEFLQRINTTEIYDLLL